MVMMAAMTAAEIAAAEAAATLAAQQAAAAAAAEAGAVAAAEAGAQAAAAEAATQAGITAAAPATGSAEAYAAQQAALESQYAAGNAGAGAELASGVMQATPQAVPDLVTRGITGAPQTAGSSAATTAGGTPLTPAGATPPPPTNAPMLNEYGEAYNLTNTAPTATSPLQLPPGAAPEAGYEVAGQGSSGPSYFDKFSAFADKHPFMTGAALYTGAYNLGLLGGEQEMPAKRTYGPQLTLSKDFRGAEATPNVYQPSYKTYAEGGVMTVGGASSDVPEPRKVINPMATISSMEEGGMPGYAKGGALSDSLDFYKQMAEGQTKQEKPENWGVGIVHDTDPDTRTLDALSAAQVRQAKVNKRANLQVPGMKRPTPMGQINLAPPGGKKQEGGGDVTEAAQGGIMQAGSSLGGYAAGGNPRLLRGPGDGMSDNIPAMIGRKQPARLADGEFVIPADVVSHLGNGSTEAGAKRLHEMMTKVRKDRTGNPKQGKQINAAKYMPK